LLKGGLKKIKMKFNFKKVASVLASGAMLASTIGIAAAANYPTPFETGTAVVYGVNSMPSDMAGAIDIYDQLKDRATGTTDASVSGEAKAVETSSQPLYLGDEVNTTKATFTKDQLSNVLGDGSVTDDDGTELDYELKVNVPNTVVKYGPTADNLDAPIIYADFDATTFSYQTRLIFPTAVNTTLLTDEAINLFGQDWVFSGSSSDLTTSKVVLFEKATSVLVNDGESVTAEGHTISIAVEDANTVSITVDGVTESKDEGWSGKINAVDLYVKNVVGPNVAGTSRYAEIYLNSNKLTLQDGNEVKLGSTDLDGTLVAFTTAGSKVSEISVTVTPYSFDDSVRYLAIGDSIVDPVFGTIKLELSSLTPELDSASKDMIVIKPSGEKKASISFTNKAGKEYDMDMLTVSNIQLNASYVVNGTGGAGANTYNATKLGVYESASTTRDIYTATTTQDINISDYFITGSNEYTQIWKVKSIDVSEGEVKVEDQGSGSSAVTVTVAGTRGSTASLTLADGSSATITLTGNASDSSAAINVSGLVKHLYTKNGAMIDLTYADAPSSNLSEIRVVEETAYNGGAFTTNADATVGKNVTVRLSHVITARSGKDMQIRDVMGANTGYTLDTDRWTDDVGDYDNYHLTNYGTFLQYTGNTDKIATMYYPEDAMSVGFYIGEVSSEITPGSTGSAGGQIAIVQDKDVSTVANKHLIVIGGSCVNTVAAKILGSDTPLCGPDFSAATNVGAGGYIIKTVASPENADKIAMLVAGFEAADTTNAVKRAKVIDGVSTEIGSEEIFPVVA
jgi:hypothetical protein